MSHDALAGRISLFSGILFDVRNPAPDDFRIEDIAHSLSLKCRFNGQTKQFYSVAQHSVYVSYMVPPEHAFAALLHDGTEAYLQDLPRPIKQLMPEYQSLELALGRKLEQAFALPADAFLNEHVKCADDKIQSLEAAIMMTDPDPVFAWIGRPDMTIFNVHPNFTFWNPEMAEMMFLRRFHELRVARMEQAA